MSEVAIIFHGMARQLRIEFCGAFYHVMARGDRREDIFLDKEDREDFLVTLGRSCEKTGWLVHAWVLMSNHYHLVVETPQANLVDGMRWLQSTYTRRFNLRHGLWGHVFGGRYKAVVVEADANGRSDYFATLLDYVHLNPVRAGLSNPKKGMGLLSYQWSSLVYGYGIAPGRRSAWMTCQIGLQTFGLRDTTAGRRRFIERLENWAGEEVGVQCGVSEIEGQGLQSTLRRGWYWGSQALKDLLMNYKKAEMQKARNRNYQSSEQERDYGMAEAGRLVSEGIKWFGLSARELLALKGSDERKVAIADTINRQTTVPQEWIAEHLQMRSAGNVSQQLFRFRRKRHKSQAVVRWVKNIRNN